MNASPNSIAVNKLDLAKVLRRLIAQDGRGLHGVCSLSLSELGSLETWLASWGEGPNWFDATGKTVPVARVTYDKLVAAYGEF